MNDDLFDRLMHLPVLRAMEPFYKKHKEVLLYLLFGGLSFLLNMGLFFLIDRTLGLNELVNNILCWVACVLFQFFTNRIWVFDGHVNSTADFFRQMAAFFGGRVFTLAVEEAILAIFITWLHFGAMPVKLGAQVAVIVLNYVISKWVIFKKKK